MLLQESCSFLVNPGTHMDIKQKLSYFIFIAVLYKETMLKLLENNHYGFVFIFAILVIEARTSCILGKYSTMEL